MGDMEMLKVPANLEFASCVRNYSNGVRKIIENSPAIEIKLYIELRKCRQVFYSQMMRTMEKCVTLLK
jgi:hypothetical protein